MYSNKFVLAVKAQGKILREQAETVSLPFGQEFSLLLKNKNTVRARVHVEIDGVDVLDGDSLIIKPNEDIDLERFMKNGNMSSGNRFKFIERSEKIENGPRGIKADDGLVKVTFEFEQQKAAYIPGPILGSPLRNHPLPIWYDTYPYNYPRYIGDRLLDNTIYGLSASSTDMVKTLNSDTSNAKAELLSTETEHAYVNRVGITVPGSVSTQTFSTTTDIISDGVQHCMILQLIGQIGERKIQEPVTVKTKIECAVCGTFNKYDAKFCHECGSALTLA